MKIGLTEQDSGEKFLSQVHCTISSVLAKWHSENPLKSGEYWDNTSYEN